MTESAEGLSPHEYDAVFAVLLQDLRSSEFEVMAKYLMNWKFSQEVMDDLEAEGYL